MTLIGWEVAGLAGALLATLAMVGPTSVLAYFVGQLWHRFRFAALADRHPGRHDADHHRPRRGERLCARPRRRHQPRAVAITLGTAAGLDFTRLHPLIFLALGAALGAAGLALIATLSWLEAGARRR